MQKKQIKIMGFQSENCKVKLFYETDGIEKRYIVEKNRKYIYIEKYIEQARTRFTNVIWKEIMQLKLEI